MLRLVRELAMLNEPEAITDQPQPKRVRKSRAAPEVLADWFARCCSSRPTVPSTAGTSTKMPMTSAGPHSMADYRFPTVDIRRCQSNGTGEPASRPDAWLRLRRHRPRRRQRSPRDISTVTPLCCTAQGRQQISHVQQQPRQKRPFRTPVCAAPIVPTLTFEPLLTFGVAGAAQIVGCPWTDEDKVDLVKPAPFPAP